MAISRRDRRIAHALKNAAILIGQGGARTPRTRALRAIAQELLGEAHRVLQDAVQAEDVAEADHAHARAKDRQGVERLRDLFARLDAGLRAEQSLRQLRGGFDQTEAFLRSFLGSTRPHRMSDAHFGHVVQTLRTAESFLHEFLPPREVAAARAELRAALADAKAAHNLASNRYAHLISARTALFRAREEARHKYIASRELLAVALRLEGQRHRLNAFLPSYERLRRAPPGVAPDDESPRDPT